MRNIKLILLIVGLLTVAAWSATAADGWSLDIYPDGVYFNQWYDALPLVVLPGSPEQWEYQPDQPYIMHDVGFDITNNTSDWLYLNYYHHYQDAGGGNLVPYAGGMYPDVHVGLPRWLGPGASEQWSSMATMEWNQTSRLGDWQEGRFGLEAYIVSGDGVEPVDWGQQFLSTQYGRYHIGVTPELPPSALLGLSMVPLGIAYLRGRRRKES